MDDHALLHGLVAIPSPTGHEATAVGWLQDRAREDGLTVRTDAAGNFVAEAGQGSRTLLFAGHIDTVPGHIPVRIEDGVLWGRGSVDAKGALAAAYCAARQHLDDPDLRIIVAGCVDEEGGSAGARGLDPGRRPDWIVNGEPSGADGITVGYRGIVRGALSFERPVQHGGAAGGTAPDALIDAWAAVREAFSFQDGFGTASGRLDSLRSRSDGRTDHAGADFQVRLPPDLDPEGARQRLERIVRDHGGVLDVRESVAAARSDRRSVLVAAFRSAIRMQGMAPRWLHKTGTADFNLLATRYPGVPLVAYGPGDSRLDHTPHERLPLQEFDRAVQVWQGGCRILSCLPHTPGRQTLQSPHGYPLHPW